LRILVIRKEVDEPTAQEIYDLHLDAPLEQAEPDRRQVLAVAFEHDATVYDAVFQPGLWRVSAFFEPLLSAAGRAGSGWSVPALPCPPNIMLLIRKVGGQEGHFAIG
jgi:hypothetical protein